jgi:hypothetical protein
VWANYVTFKLLLPGVIFAKIKWCKHLILKNIAQLKSKSQRWLGVGFHDTTQRCANWGDQLPVRNWLALPSFIPFHPHPCIDMLFLSLYTLLLSAFFLTNPVTPSLLRTCHKDWPANPLHPTSTGIHHVFWLLRWKSSTSCSYLLNKSSFHWFLLYALSMVL